MPITQYFTWLSDDSFFWREWEFYDCNNIDILDNSRYIDWAKQPNISEIWLSIGNDVTVCIDWETYPVFATDTWTYIWFGWFNSSVSDGWMSGAYRVEQIGTSSLPVTYWFKSWYVRQQTFNWTWTPFNNVITTNVPSGIPTASCVWPWRIFFAVANKIYVIDTDITDPTSALSQCLANPANQSIPFWYTIKHMYIYMDIMSVVTTNWKDTIIYQLIQEDSVEWRSYNKWSIRYYHTKQWIVCLWAQWEWNNIYWYTKNAIYKSNGTDSQKVKVFWKNELADTFSTNSFCTISDWIFKIADGTVLWEYWHKKPWYWPVLIKKTRNRQITAMSWRLEVFYNGTSVYWGRDNDFTTSPYRDWSYTTLPYEWSVFAQKLQEEAIRIWFMLPAYSTYTNTSQLCSITVQVINDEMDAKWISTPVTVVDITTPTSWVAERYVDITIWEINTALANAWYNPDCHYVRITINGIRWDLWNTTTLYWENLWRKTPKLFSVEFISKDIKKWIPQ